MKKQKTFISFILLFAICLSCNVPAFAKSTNPKNSSLSQPAVANKMISTMVEEAKIALQKECKKQKSGGISINKAATPLTSVYISSISSDEGGYERFNAGVVGKSTQYDHGGLTYICTFEIGYSNYYLRKPMYNGRKATLYSDTAYDPDHDHFADGAIYVWKIENVDSGTFTYESTSAVTPYNTYNDWLDIK